MSDARKSSLAILVVSCDRYSDLWRPFFTVFFRNWPDCPYPIYLGSNSLSYDDTRVQTLLVGEDLDWSAGLLVMLDRISEEFVLLTLEDFFLRQPVNTTEIDSACNFLSQSEGQALRLIPRPAGRGPLHHDGDYAEILPNAPYRVSLQATMWRRSFLQRLLISSESPWQFEMQGTLRVAAASGMYCATRQLFPYGHHVVERGKWFPWEAWRYRRQNVGCDFDARPVMGFGEALRWLGRKGLSILRENIEKA